MSPLKRYTDPGKTPDQLHSWILYQTGLTIPRVPVCPDHDAPFEYIRRAYFEPTKDLIVWAPRGGGKTRLAALATLLDLLHKPGCSIRILGGSLEQSLRMWEHLMPDVERLIEPLLLLKSRRAGSRRIELIKGSTAAVLTQSQRSVRGLRVQKLRCDEVEMFDRAVWEAAQLVTRSRNESGVNGRAITGAVEAFSTMHSPGGLMDRLVESAKATGTPRVIKWCLLEVLERCPPERECSTCPLYDECRGVAKTKCNGFIPIDDAIAMKRRVSLETWESEMLCRRPSVRGSVFPSFDLKTHVVDRDPVSAESLRSLAMDFGFANPFACLWIETDDDGATFVFDEYVQEQRTIDEHIDHIEATRAKRWGPIRKITCDPAGNSRNDHSGKSNVQVLRKRGYAVQSRKSGIVEGLELIRAALKPASGPPRLFIHPRCTNLIKAMRALRYPPTGGELPIKDGQHDHVIDALRYHFVNATAARPLETRSY